ncbi:MAG: glycosyltransferase [Bacteroidales bacterium]|nr:glycosyltransferase [Bacteroidales bacterium]
MGFADAYLLKAGLREALIEPEPHPRLQISVILPVYNESGLERCLDSLFQCTCGAGREGTDPDGSGFRAEVLILINAPSDAPPAVLEQNQATLEATRAWIVAHPHPCIAFFVRLDHSFSRKEAGVGSARKILMDEASRRFSALGRPEGIIASMDADALVRPNYLEALVTHFEGGGPWSGSGRGPESGPWSGSGRGPESGSEPEGCSIRFEHPLEGEEFPPAVYRAITQYELHLRYYLQSVRFTGYPFAYHTVGSSFAVRSDIYCMEGGMNRRQGGEDFYFIQKVARRGRFSQCNTTCITPSPRPSDRVPFGTGPAVRRLSLSEEPLMTYNPDPFVMLSRLFDESGSPEKLAGPWPEPLGSFLEEQGFEGALSEIRHNSASAPAFRKRFWRWFSMFRIMKFLHYARERGYPDLEIGPAASELLQKMDPEGRGIPSVGPDLRKLLQIYRMLDLR